MSAAGPDPSQIALPSSTALHTREATKFLATVYVWMFIGLALTSAVAWFVASTPGILYAILDSPFILWGLLILELLLVIVLSAAINKISAGVATFLFLLYSAVNGATLSFILLVYTGESVFMAFVAATCLFATLSFYGYVTGRDLTSLGSLLTVGLIALIICGVINMFVGSNGFGYLISLVGIVVFLGLTAYDTQKILRVGERLKDQGYDAVKKAAILGALALYLDFINLFLYLLRIFGKRRQ